MMEWISVDDALPEQYDHVLVGDGKTVTTSYFQDGEFVATEVDIVITHWMPLPDFPVSQ